MPMPRPANQLQPDHAPTPFSAAEIRAACAVGKTIRVRTNVPGQPSTFRVVRYLEVDDEGAIQEFQATDADGTPAGDAVRRHSTWLDLQGHASQPAAATVIEEVDLVLPFGTEACWRYTVSSGNDRKVFWFARRLPGMPVQVEEWTADQLRSRSVVLESR